MKTILAGICLSMFIVLPSVVMCQPAGASASGGEPVYDDIALDPPDPGNPVGDFVFGSIIAAIFTSLFFVIVMAIPIIIALIRKHNNRVAIILLTILGGWTGVGWLGALIWSVMNPIQVQPSKR